MNRNTCIYFFSSFRKIVLSHPILGISWYQIERKYHYFLKANTIFYFLTSTLVVTLVVYNQPQCLYLTRWLTQPIVYSHAAPIWSGLLCSFCILVSPLNSFSKDMAGFRHDLVCTANKYYGKTNLNCCVWGRGKNTQNFPGFQMLHRKTFQTHFIS